MLRNRNSVTWVVKVNGVTTDIVNIRDIADYKVKLFNDTSQEDGWENLQMKYSTTIVTPDITDTCVIELSLFYL